MFTDAPERLRIKAITSAELPHAGITIKAARVSAEGGMVSFAAAPEFPALIRQNWLETYVPTMPEPQFQRLLSRLRAKRWTEPELAARVLPLRTPSADDS